MTSYEQQVEDELYQELLQQDPIYQRFIYVNFVSKSKGRGRKRKHWEEVELIADLDEPNRPPRYYSSKKFPWDTKATEALPDVAKDLAENKLMRRIRGY